MRVLVAGICCQRWSCRRYGDHPEIGGGGSVRLGVVESVVIKSVVVVTGMRTVVVGKRVISVTHAGKKVANELTACA